jgi:hypothetical protein
MEHQNVCHGCRHAHDCQRIYDRLGRANGPSVAGPAVVAFVLPVLVFVTSFGVSRWLLHGRLEQQSHFPLAFVTALLVTTCVMWVVSRVARPGR